MKMEFTLEIRPPTESNSDLRKFLVGLFDNSLKNIFGKKLYPVSCDISQKTWKPHAFDGSPFAFEVLSLNFNVSKERGIGMKKPSNIGKWLEKKANEYERAGLRADRLWEKLLAGGKSKIVRFVRKGLV